jgi:hypothetical protein
MHVIPPVDRFDNHETKKVSFFKTFSQLKLALKGEVTRIATSSNGTVKLTALWPPASSPDADSLPASIAVTAFAGLSLGLDQPKKKPWCSKPGLGWW